MITGSEGFVGRHLCAYLDSIKINYVGYDLVNGQDIRDLHQLDKFFEENNVTEVVNLAALAGVRRGESYPADYISTNINGVLNVVKMCEKYKVFHLVHYSSSSSYGESNPPIIEDFKKEPKSIYGITKLAGERIVQSSNIDQTTILIPFTIYGGDSESGCRKDSVIHKWIEQIKSHKSITIYGDGSSQRGYVYIDDIVRLTYKILNCWGQWEHEIFNVGGSEVISLKEIIGVFKKLVKSATMGMVDSPSADIYQNFADTSKIEALLQWKPESKFIENVSNIIKKELNIKK